MRRDGKAVHIDGEAGSGDLDQLVERESLPVEKNPSGNFSLTKFFTSGIPWRCQSDPAASRPTLLA